MTTYHVGQRITIESVNNEYTEPAEVIAVVQTVTVITEDNKIRKFTSSETNPVFFAEVENT